MIGTVFGAKNYSPMVNPQYRPTDIIKSIHCISQKVRQLFLARFVVLCPMTHFIFLPQAESLAANKFTFDNFFSFYRHLVGRTEVDKIFDEL